MRVAAFVALAGVVALVGWKSLRSQQVQDHGTLAGGLGARGAPEASGLPDGSLETGAAGTGPSVATGGRRIVVDVSGAVRRPGVYRFEHGRRVIDAIRRAGGATGNAAASGINRAALLADGQHVVVPSANTTGPGSAVGGAGAAAGLPPVAGTEAPISLGTATQAQLEEIEGIGPVTAQSILEFRDSQGGVSSVDELDQVTGIGPVTMEALRARLQP